MGAQRDTPAVPFDESGESGPGARPMDPAWVLDLRD